jgi:hypothetical protein
VFPAQGRATRYDGEARAGRRLAAYALLCPVRRSACEDGSVLGSMRGKDGGPNAAMRALGILLVLLLAGPLTVVLARGLQRLVDAAL